MAETEVSSKLYAPNGTELQKENPSQRASYIRLAARQNVIALRHEEDVKGPRISRIVARLTLSCQVAAPSADFGFCFHARWHLPSPFCSSRMPGGSFRAQFASYSLPGGCYRDDRVCPREDIPLGPGVVLYPKKDDRSYEGECLCPKRISSLLLYTIVHQIVIYHISSGTLETKSNFSSAGVL